MERRRSNPVYAARWVNLSIGVAACAAMAALMSAIFNNTSHKLVLPLLFIAVMVFAALRFGALAGIFGGLAAAMIFSYFLFTPIGSFRVDKDTARSNIGWMLLIGIPASYFLDAGRGSGPLKKG
jgi:K+-sensing histidine kinase KdpD